MNNCVTCPTNASKSGNICTCDSGFNQHINQCVITCPAGYVKDLNSNICLNYCDGCSTCNSTTQSCTSCNSGYYLYKGKCVTSCPVTAPITSGVCKDFDSTLINGQYILHGLMNDYFNESEIFGMGISVTGFMGFKDSASSGALVTNCGQTHLLGGNFLSGKGAVISRSWTKLNPHWSIKIGFTLWKIDSWDDESVYFKVDNEVKKTITYSANEGFSNICGGPQNDLAVPYNLNMTHSSSSLSIQFSTNLDENTYSKSYGVREIYILVDFCSSNCASCDASGCLSCLPSFALHQKQCLNVCPSNTYQSSQACFDCNIKCLTCTTTATTCTSCSSSLYLNPDKTCQPTCPTSYYQKSSDRTCAQCDSSCYECVAPGDANFCQKCTGSLYLYNNKCQNNCPDKWFKNRASNNNQCFPCIAQCKSCDGPNNCLPCEGNLYFDSTSTKCVTTCPNGTYQNTYNNVCSSCDSSCETCTMSPNNCTSCKGTTYLNQSDNTCSKCPKGKYYMIE